MIASYPKRIVCLTEEPTETLYLLGEQDRIVGISGFTVRPKQARRDKPKVSAFISAKIGKILDLKPDLVVGFSDLQGDIAAELIKAGVIAYHELMHNGHKGHMGNTTTAAAITVEGTNDDISAPGQCVAALNLLTGLPDNKKASHLEEGAGHYGIFAGKSWRNNIRPLVLDFIDANNDGPLPKKRKPANKNRAA